MSRLAFTDLASQYSVGESSVQWLRQYSGFKGCVLVRVSVWVAEQRSEARVMLKHKVAFTNYGFRAVAKDRR